VNALAQLLSLSAPCPTCGIGHMRAHLDRRERLYLSCATCRSRLFAPLDVERAGRLMAAWVLIARPDGQAAIEEQRARMGLRPSHVQVGGGSSPMTTTGADAPTGTDGT